MSQGTTVTRGFETVIGLEVHLQFNTQTKIFCRCANLFGQKPNSLTCPVCLGLPGSLPVLNERALEYAIKVALALNCEVSPFIKFDRKNYYYPDLPKGYQISQYDHPIARNGHLLIPTEQGDKKIRIHRAHLEEDAGKLIHDPKRGCSLVDYNRTGTPLMEIVTEPDLRSPQEAYDYLLKLKLTLQYLSVSDCDMEKGSLRCDANISLRPQGEVRLGTKSEVKNMNSFKAVKAALNYEEERQKKTLLSGQGLVQETRLWNDIHGTTIPMRSKEEAHDYRYFPEPDLVPFTISDALITKIRQSLPELPDAKLKRFQQTYQLSTYDTQILIQEGAFADFFEVCAGLYPETKYIANWMIGPLLSELNARKVGIGETQLKPQNFCDIIQKVTTGTLSNLAGKEVLKSVLETGQPLDQIIREKGLAQVSDEESLKQIVDEVISENEKIVIQIKQGKESAIGFLIGEAMKKSKGKANPKVIGQLLRRRLQDD